MKEKENYLKFNVFYKKHLFDIAFDYARNSKYNLQEISEIHKKYGDYLYQNSEFQKAIEQYCKTIIYCHPSTIIEKFLDNSKTEHLVYFLEYIHENKDFKEKFQKEMSNYSKLLIHLYSKMKKITKLTNFIDKIDFSSLDKVEIDVIINICLDQNQEKIAFSIASKAKYCNRILEIFINSNRKFLF